MNLPAIIAAARAAPLPRGSRRASCTIPENMLTAFLASEARAWSHSPLAGALWEAGLRASRAIALSKKINPSQNKPCADSGNMSFFPCCHDGNPAGRIPETTSENQIMKITDTTAIKAALANFQPSAAGAYATCRCLPGQYAQENQQEWAERGTINGKPATVFYIFENSEAEVEDGADMPFDAGHISCIEIEEPESEIQEALASLDPSAILCDLPDSEFVTGGAITDACRAAGYDESGRVVVNNMRAWNMTVAQFAKSISPE